MNEHAGGDGGRIISPFWTAQEAADYCRVSLNTIHTMFRRGDIKAHRIGGQWRLLKSDLDSYLGLGAQQAAPSPGGLRVV